MTLLYSLMMRAINKKYKILRIVKCIRVLKKDKVCIDNLSIYTCTVTADVESPFIYIKFTATFSFKYNDGFHVRMCN